VAVAVLVGRTAEGTAVILATAAMGLTATEGVIDGSTAAGTSDKGESDNDGVIERDGEISDGFFNVNGTGADGRTGAVLTEIFPRITCAADGDGTRIDAATTKASIRLTSPL
jgi:hypothetical protein